MRSTIALAAILAGLLSAGAAHSQTLLNPDGAIIQAESGGNPTAQNKNSTASGLFGDTNGTWAVALQACGGPCGTITQFPTAASAPAANQIAANNALINQRGLQDWLCPGCDASFTQFVANNGGPSAFQTNGLSTNPDDFANLNNDPAALQAFITNANVATDGTPTTGTGSATVTNTSLATEPFQYIYTTMINGITQQISTALQSVNALVYPYLIAALTLATAFMGIRVMFGRMSFDTLASFVIRATIVGTLLAPDNQYFIQWIQQPIQQLPGQIAAAFGVPDAGPAALFDDSAHALSAIANTIAANAPESLRAMANSIFADVLWFIGVGALAVLFSPFLLATFLLLLMITLAPVPIIFGLFPLLSGWTKGFADVVATLALGLLAVDMIISIIEGGIINVLTAFNVSGSSQVDLAAFGPLIVVLGGMALSLKYAGPIVARIAGGISIPIGGSG